MEVIPSLHTRWTTADSKFKEILMADAAEFCNFVIEDAFHVSNPFNLITNFLKSEAA